MTEYEIIEALALSLAERDVVLLGADGEPITREELADQNEREGWTVEMTGSQGHVVRTEAIHLSAEGLNQLYTRTQELTAELMGVAQ